MENFDNKYVIVGDIVFNDSDGANILKIEKSLVCITQEEIDELIDFAEEKGLDYIIPQDYIYPISICGIPNTLFLFHMSKVGCKQ